VQWVQGCLPSHFIFFLLHSSHARVTRLRFCKGGGAREAEVEELGDVGPCNDCQGGEAIGLGSSSTSKDSGEEWVGVLDDVPAVVEVAAGP
jgi:hypothetical protein